MDILDRIEKRIKEIIEQNFEFGRQWSLNKEDFEELAKLYINESDSNRRCDISKIKEISLFTGAGKMFFYKDSKYPKLFV